MLEAFNLQTPWLRYLVWGPLQFNPINNTCMKKFCSWHVCILLKYLVLKLATLVISFDDGPGLHVHV